jgi:UDP-glucose 4-epimerase
MKVLVMGGDGFLGSHFVDRVLEEGHEVTVFDRFPYRRSRNLEHCRHEVTLFSGEFTNRDNLETVLEGQDIVYDFICLTNPAASWSDPLIEVEQNIEPTVRFLETAVEAGVKKVVFPSSGGTVYGKRGGLLRESDPVAPYIPYAIGKIAVEYFLAYFREKSGLASDIYRISNAYGPRQPVGKPQGVIAVWMNAILEGAAIRVYGGGEVKRDYVYVGDVAELMLFSLGDLEASGVYNVGTGRDTSITELLEMFKVVINRPFEVEFERRRPSDTLSIALDSARLLEHFPQFRFHTLEEKLPSTWEYFKEYRPTA